MEKFTHNKIANLSAEKNRYHITEGNGFCLGFHLKEQKPGSIVINLMAKKNGSLLVIFQ